MYKRQLSVQEPEVLKYMSDQVLNYMSDRSRLNSFIVDVQMYIFFIVPNFRFVVLLYYCIVGVSSRPTLVHVDPAGASYALVNRHVSATDKLDNHRTTI